jgi:hypothetical protein
VFKIYRIISVFVYSLHVKQNIDGSSTFSSKYHSFMITLYIENWFGSPNPINLGARQEANTVPLYLIICTLEIK